MISEGIKGGIILPGARKSGTSSLFKMIVKSDAVLQPKSKEPMLFNLQKPYKKRYVNWYIKSRNIGEDNNKYWVDASSFYFFDRLAPQKIRKIVGSPWVIIILRDPVERTFSAFLEMKKKVPCPEKRSFGGVLSSLFDMVVKGDYNLRNAEDILLKKAVSKGLIMEDYLCGNYLEKKVGFPHKYNFEDRLIPYRYFTNSLYKEKIENFEYTFENVKVVRFEDLLYSTKSVVNGINSFLSTKDSPITCVLPHKHRTQIPNSRLTRSLINFKRNIPLADKFVESMYNIEGLKRIKKKIFFNGKPSLSKEHRVMLEKLLKESINIHESV